MFKYFDQDVYKRQGDIYMRIQAVTPIVNFRAQNSRRTIQNNKSVTPVRDGLNTAGAWFGFGVGLDLLSRKIQFSKSPFKNSIADVYKRQIYE